MAEKLKSQNNVVDLDDPAWCQALSLSERLENLDIDSTELAEIIEKDKEKAEKRLQKWISQEAFKNHRDLINSRLRSDHINKTILQFLLIESPLHLRDRINKTPEWLCFLHEAFSNPIYSNSMVTPTILFNNGRYSEMTEDEKMFGLLILIRPILGLGQQKLHKAIKEISREGKLVPFNIATIEEILFRPLPPRLLNVISRTLTLELNVARLQGELSGESPQDRFISFLQLLSNTEYSISILKEYPVLARYVINYVNQWVDESIEFLSRLCEDWNDILSVFTDCRPDDKLAFLDSSAGDSHRRGHSVHIIRFESGFQLVYKPRSLSIDIHFQNLLDFIGEQQLCPTFRKLSILDKITHGWVEFIHSKPCTTENEIKRFYERIGGYLAALYSLNACDFHYENLIAEGEYPVLVDLETLFHFQVSPRDKIKLPSSLQNALRLINKSVVSVGLLPQRIWRSEEQQDGIEISGLGGPGGQQSPFNIPTWSQAGTDVMHFIRKKVDIREKQNRPKLKETPINALEYCEEIISGFSSVYEYIAKTRKTLLGSNGLINNFKNAETRYVARATNTYGLMLNESFHPDLLRNALYCDRFFDDLWYQVAEDPSLIKLVRFERMDLHNGDIPIFKTTPGSRDLSSSSGKKIKNFFSETELEQVSRHLNHFCAQDLSRQCWFIRSSLLTLAMNDIQKKPTTEIKIDYSVNDESLTNRSELINLAKHIGDRLVDLAIQGAEGDSTWIGVSLANDNYWTLAPTGFDLYCGSSGIGLFLGYLGFILKNEKYTSVAYGIVQQFVTQLSKLENSINLNINAPHFHATIGAFGDIGGIIYLLTHMGKLWDKNEYFEYLERFVDQLTPLIKQDAYFDIINGSAGLIACLHSLYRVMPSLIVKNAAVECGNHLLDNLQEMKTGIGWMTTKIASQPLTGYSHGVSGISWSLFRLFEMSGEEKFLTAAKEGIKYERSVFDKNSGNWPDFRNFDKIGQELGKDSNSDSMVAWCHGGAGIGLSRLLARNYFDNASVIDSELRHITELILSSGFLGNQSLCHGSLGNLDILLQLGQVIKDDNLKIRIRQFENHTLYSIKERGFICGIPLGVETPGLMTGIAGIGYELLRLVHPDKIPSVLTIDPPY